MDLLVVKDDVARLFLSLCDGVCVWNISNARKKRKWILVLLQVTVDFNWHTRMSFFK